MTTLRRRGRNEGTVFYRADKGKWYIRVSLGVGQDGKRRRKTEVGGKTKTAALKKLRALQTAAAAGQLTADNVNVQVGVYLEGWLTKTKASLADRTWDTYASVIRTHVIPRLGTVQLHRLKRHHIEDMLTAMADLPAATRRKALVTLSLAIRQGGLIADPTKGVAKPLHERPEMKVWTADQAREFLKAAEGNRLEALFHLALDSGARQGELLALRWEDVDLDGGAVRIVRSLVEKKGEFIIKQPKTKAGRRLVQLTPRTVEALRRHQVAMLAEGNIAGPVFCGRKGQWYDKSNLRRSYFWKLIAAAKLPRLRFHDLRHTSASLQLSAGVSLKALAARLGHQKPSTTLDVYVHLMPGEQEQCTAALQKLLG